MQVQSNNQSTNIKSSNLKTPSRQKQYLYVVIGVVLVFIVLGFVYLYKDDLKQVKTVQDLKTIIPKKNETYQESKISQQDITKVINQEKEKKYSEFSTKYSKDIVNQSIGNVSKSIISVGNKSATMKIFENVKSQDELKEKYDKVAEALYVVDMAFGEELVIDNFDQLMIMKQYHLSEDPLFSKSYIEGEKISVWFDNIRDESISEEEAKNKTYALISRLYKQLKNNEITMQQAGEIIKNDSYAKSIDPSIDTNAYSPFRSKEGETPYFGIDNLEEILWNLKEGEYSEILESEEYYAVYKLNKKVTNNQVITKTININ